MGAIWTRFGMRLPLVDFLQESTIANLCSWLREGATHSPGCLITLQKGNSNAPIFIIHPQGGGVLCYLDLAKALSTEETLYGLQAPGYDSDEPFLGSIEAMADRYLIEMQRITPHGPYRLTGWSMGGIIAFEIARRLEAQGELVDFLGLLDVYEPEHENGVYAVESPSVYQTQLDIAVNYLGLEPLTLTSLDEEEIYVLLLQRTKALHLTPQDAGIELIQHQVRIMMAHQLALDSYRSKTKAHIKTDIHLFRASECSDGPLIEPQRWQVYTVGKVFVIPVPGNHHNLVTPPNVFALAEAMKAALLQRSGVPEAGDKQFNPKSDQNRLVEQEFSNAIE
jgi:thioesterase domain-containing protein